MIIILIIASVPFVGNVTDGRLLCNAACSVEHDGQTVTYPGPVSMAVPPGVYVVRPA